MQARRCVNCYEPYERSQVDMGSIMRRREFEAKLGFEASVSVWESLCNTCQRRFVWFAGTQKGMATAYWLKEEAMHKMRKEEESGIQENPVQGRVGGS